MEQVKRHIDAFGKFLHAKGYTGHFLVDFEFPGKITESLADYFTVRFGRAGQVAEINLSLFTYAEWKADDSDYTTCTFRVNYHPGEGFIVKGMEVARRCNGSAFLKFDVTVETHARMLLLHQVKAMCHIPKITVYEPGRHQRTGRIKNSL